MSIRRPFTAHRRAQVHRRRPSSRAHARVLPDSYYGGLHGPRARITESRRFRRDSPLPPYQRTTRVIRDCSV